MTLQFYIIATFLLLVAFQLKHLLCDYFWQGTYMLGKFHPTEWHMPLLAHATVHAVATFFICFTLVDVYHALTLAYLDMFTHFWVDRLKVVCSRKYDSKTDKEFWWLLGGDQFLHHITHYFIILAVLANIHLGA